jgi:Terminase RNaseH-like domain
VNEKLSNSTPNSIPGPNASTEDYYVGVDLGQKRDHSVIAVILKKKGQIFLVHLKRFALGTEYQTVIEYLRLVGERFRNVRMYYIDQTGVGESFPENARRAGIKNVKGLELSLPRKSDVMAHLKQVMEQKRLHIPQDRELIIEMNAEIAKLTDAGKTKFTHRSGTHDDRLWALALAVYGSRYEAPSYHPFAVSGHVVPSRFAPNLPRNLFKPAMAVVPARPYDNQPSGPPQRICSVCGSKYTYESGKDSPCGHVKSDGTFVLPEPRSNTNEPYYTTGQPIPWPPPRDRIGY